MKTVIVTGGRDYEDYAMVADVLDFIKPELVVQSYGGGADFMAIDWANATNTRFVTVDGDWDVYDKTSVPRRNLKMLQKYPEAIVVAFPGGKGTQNCIKEAVRRNMIVLQVHE